MWPGGRSTNRISSHPNSAHYEYPFGSLQCQTLPSGNLICACALATTTATTAKHHQTPPTPTVTFLCQPKSLTSMCPTPRTNMELLPYCSWGHMPFHPTTPNLHKYIIWILVLVYVYQQAFHRPGSFPRNTNQKLELIYILQYPLLLVFSGVLNIHLDATYASFDSIFMLAPDACLSRTLQSSLVLSGEFPHRHVRRPVDLSFFSSVSDCRRTHNLARSFTHFRTFQASLHSQRRTILNAYSPVQLSYYYQ